LSDICRASLADQRVLAEVIAAAFTSLEAAHWLVTDPDHRQRVLAGQFELIVEHALHHGVVETTPDRTAAAVWLPHPVPEIPGYRDRQAIVCGPYAERFQALDAAMERAHPDRPVHEHLALLAVVPARQRSGIGGKLLRNRHLQLDQAGIPAYLEASSSRTRAIYLRYGYWPCGKPFAPPGCAARFWPMLRLPC
jgi:ribosomal protein S18 acetylase RimI-like enzyme